MKEPDWDRMRELSAEMHALREAGKLDRAAWERIFDDASVAAGDFVEGLESFYNFEPDDGDED